MCISFGGCRGLGAPRGPRIGPAGRHPGRWVVPTGELVIRLAGEAGFAPVVVGPLARAKEFDPGPPVLGWALAARDLRRSLYLTP